MDTTQFSVPGLATSGEAIDLSNVLNSIKGVASISIDLVAHVVSIEFDRSYTSEHTLAKTCRCSGYPLAAMG